ncbi:hypothetical protein BHM03_00031044 [Ensete ventricosum]|nr:hypothetical protein BHM03_00031044 [Ensete ventricosum]
MSLYLFPPNGHVDAYPVYSMATPTIDGAREVLSYLGADDPASMNHGQKVIITDLREEAVVYINGSPFVLRELDRPVDTLKHVGISGPLVEHMEARLKEDIFAEVTQSGGQMLLHREEYNPVSNQISVIGYWEKISLDDVKTPAEVFAALKADGYRIEYKRIPLTREREALAVDVDAIQYCKDECTVETHFVSTSPFQTLPFQSSGEDALKQGDYRDILSLTRVLVYGPKSKDEVDMILERYTVID